MPLNVNQINDAQMQRQKKNRTDSQKKNVDKTTEGVVVNTLIRTPQNSSIDELYDSMIISADAKMPEKLSESHQDKPKHILPLSLIATGVMGTIAMITALVRKSSKVFPNVKPEQELDNLTRNVSITNESVQGLYQMVHCPNKKTILAATGVVAIGAMAFMGKMFMDGFKDVWVKKKEADIQKNLQENLIAVETQSFSGKIQIIRSMLSDKAKEFNEYLCDNPEKCSSFKGFSSSKQNFGSGDKSENTNNNSENFKYFGLGVLTLGAVLGLGYLSLKNLRAGKKSLNDYVEKTREEISKIIARSGKTSDISKETDKTNLKRMFQSLGSNEEDIRTSLAGLKWRDKNEFTDKVVFDVTKSTTKTDRAIGGDGNPKPAFNSYVNGDYKAFLYNYLLDSDNPQFKMLFWSVAGLSALAYGGKVLGEAVKEVQVKKMNAETELNLQKRLVATELRNFKAKKDSAINPLCEEFYNQVDKGKPKAELKTMAENILFEVKNGPPFVYS